LNGIVGGHYGPGVKGVIPTRAVAKLSFRLVPDQDPEKIAQLFQQHIAQVSPPEVAVSVRTLSPVRAAVIDRNHPAIRAARFAFKKGFGAFPVFLRSGGSIPVVNAFQEHLGIPTALMGFGLPDDCIHAPNEKFHLPNFYRGIETSIWYLAAAASALRRRAVAELASEWSLPDDHRLPLSRRQR
jgi:acetylornithine deacetylase/succinyl-diaminopimelate desuccinylase-like protein